MRRTLDVVLIVALACVAACTSGPRYGEDDLRPEADLTFPGATETDRDFLADESGRSIHGDDLSSPATLDRSFDLVVRTPNADVYAWYDAELARRGWSRSGPAPGDEGLDDDVTFRHVDGSRTDTFSIRAGFPGTTVNAFTTRYAIDVDGD